MKCYVRYTLLLTFICLASPAFSAGEDEVKGPIPAEVIRVLDGDTFDVRAQIWVGHYIETRVRLDGLDTPELRGKCEDEKIKAKAAKDHLSNLIAQKEVLLTHIKNGKYAGRVLARANTADGIDLSEHLMEAGYARPYHGKKRGSWCDKT